MNVEEAKEYLRLDGNDEDTFVEQLIQASDIYIETMVGAAYKNDEKLLRLSTLLQKKLIADMYEVRSSEVPKDTKQDRIVTSILNALELAGCPDV